MKKYNPLQELDTSPDSEFIRAVDFVVAQPIQGHLLKPVSLGYTPFVFRLCCDTGIETVSTNYLVIEKVMSLHLNRMDRDGINSHNVTPEQLKQIPVQLNDPIAVIQSQTKANGLVVLTELYETDKFSNRQNPMIVAIHLKNNRNKTQHMKITSVHGRSNEFIVDNLSSNLLIYLNREKCRNLMISHFTPERLRNLHKDNNRNERLKVIAEMCDLEMHKGRFQLKTTAPIAEGNFLLQTKNDHLYETDNNAKIKTMQEEMHKDRSLNTGVTTMEARCYFKENGHLSADNHNATPTHTQAAKCTIPKPTGYKTEEDLRQFRLAICKQALTQIEPTDIQQWQRLYNHAKATLTTEQKQHLSVAERYLYKSLNDSNATEQYRAFCITNFYRNTSNEILHGTINIPNPYALDKSITQKPTVKQDKGIDLA